jgi:hypothetical protein
MIPPKDSLPEDPAEWKDIQVSFPRLPQDSPASCPISVTEVMDHVRRESADLDDSKEESLRFIRTAQVEGSRCWLWSYTESDGEVCYAFFRESTDGDTFLSLTSTSDLTPEQYLLADHYDLVYWS